MFTKENRVFSFIMVAMVYVLATASALIIFWALPFHEVWLKLLIADVCATVITFIFSLIFKNASVYDPYWSVQPIVITLAFAVGKRLTIVRLLPLIAVFFWGIRLTANWAYTFKNLNHQDWRYTMLKEKTGAFYPIVNFLGIHMFPTLVVYACVLPVVYTFILDFDLNAFSIIFFALSIGATVIQMIADLQMQSFRNKKTGTFIRVGLWKHARHPNYLGEILMWWGIALAFICANPSLWYLGLGALINTLMFIFISVPMADKRMAKRQGFSEYKKQTNVFLPIQLFK
ncbi:MAG: DUF1295 domain-containing protein [Clostridiales bacterium]|nr:DUF1295 domain-containing protein [Clostridiales bacterium]